MKHITKDWFVDVRFSLVERPDNQWDLVIYDKGGGKVTGIGPLSWDNAVRECYKCQRLRTDFFIELQIRKDFEKGAKND